MIVEFIITLTNHGQTNGLLMHNGRLADPLDQATKDLKLVHGKQKKTDEDHAEIALLEFRGGLYIDRDVGPYIPGVNIERCLVQGAKLTKQGVKVTQGLFISTDVNPIKYKGPRDADGLWKAGFYHRAGLVVNRGRVVRCRPWFREWSVQAEGRLDTSVLDIDQLDHIATNAGQYIGLGDWRPRFGRFTAKVEQTA